MSSDTNNLYAFKDFTLDVDESVLLRQGRPVPITPKAFHLLRILVEHHGAVVDKEKLISEIWADSIVEDGNLAFTAQLLRKVLGDDAKTPIYIETVPRRGYRFIAEVSRLSHGPEEVAQVERAGEFSRRPTLLRVAVGATVVVLISVGWLFLSRTGIQTQSAPILTEPFKAERLSSTGNAAQAAISPNGKLVAYTDQTGNGKWSVWLRQLSTAENIQIIPPADVKYGGLVFSRDNSSLFLVRGENTSSRLDIFRVNVFGGILTKLAQNTQGWISVSPDDKKVSFVRCEYRPDDYCSLFVVDVDGRNESRVVTRGEPIRIGDNQFSSDGRSIAFAAGQSFTGSNEFGLFNVELASRNEKAITSERFFNIKRMQWLPGGDELLFTAARYAQEKFSIWKVSGATGAVEQLTRDDTSFSGLSIDAEARNLVATKVDNNFTISIEDLADRTKRRTLAVGGFSTFSPNGRIVFESKDRDIWIIDADGYNKRQLTNDTSEDLFPIVTGDGRTIIFSSNRSGVNQLWRMDIDGSNQEQLTRAEGGYARFASRNGDLVYYTAGISGAMRAFDATQNAELVLPDIGPFPHAFSPDGILVASFAHSGENGGELTVEVRDLLSLSLVELISGVDDNKAEPVHLQWSLDGRSINYVVRRSDEYEVWKCEIDQKRAVLIAKLGTEPLEKVALAPDGRSMAVVRGDWLHDAVLITGLKF